MVSYTVCIKFVIKCCLQNNGHFLFRRELHHKLSSLHNPSPSQGNEILFRIAVALLEYHGDTLVKLDLEDMIKVYINYTFIYVQLCVCLCLYSTCVSACVVCVCVCVCMCVCMCVCVCVCVCVC